MTDTAPFAPQSISCRLYPHNDLDAPSIVREVCAQAKLALDGGFDGIMTSEHHGGFSGYMPLPLQMVSFILEDTDRGWAAPCPLLLPLRPTAMVAEEIAWLDARHPGRVGLGVGSGALELDFTAMGLRLEDATPRFKAELPKIVAMLRGDALGELEGDKALQRCKTNPIPVLSTAVSPAAARRAARYGAGIILEGMSSKERQQELCAEYDGAGGTRSKVLIRRVWVGAQPDSIVDQQRKVYESYSSAAAMRHWPADQTIHSDDPVEVAERVALQMKEINVDAVNLRIHLPGVTPAQARDQITRIAAEVVPALRTRIGAPA
jgi:alkanesulfonate monooxygenase SsuD/methylene tetrahydromethanopterin reductase-like flavin-dependent oxidoreductase (luciferase family)